MSSRMAIGAALVILPLAFNGLFVALGRTFDYPDVLRRAPGDILARFAAGGRRLQLLWWAFTLTAVALVPVAGGLAAVLGGADPGLAQAGLAVGVSAGLVQAVALARWPFLVPVLARLHADASSAAERAAVELAFRVTHRYVGVAVGEHLGYLLTGAWTVLVGLGLGSGSAPFPLLGWLGVGIGALVGAGSLEFVARPGERGWPLLERLVPVAYIAWSLWLVAVGIALIAVPA